MILLDTHVLTRWIEDSGHLSDRAARAIEEQEGRLVSPVSFWEFTVLAERG